MMNYSYFSLLAVIFLLYIGALSLTWGFVEMWKTRFVLALLLNFSVRQYFSILCHKTVTREVTLTNETVIMGRFHE